MNEYPSLIILPLPLKAALDPPDTVFDSPPNAEQVPVPKLSGTNCSLVALNVVVFPLLLIIK
jgi:hypothetical protein